MSSPITTRFLIVSDTHGRPLEHTPTEKVDVAIHCGDLTEESKLAEFKTTLDLLKKINAPLKLIIAGNHDWTLDIPVFKQKLSTARLDIAEDSVKREYGAYGEAMAVLDSEDAKSNGIFYLLEGTHRFKLANGAHLTVYASPYTPSVDEWGFNYNPTHEHDWQVENDVDVAITHCPPKGVLDMTGSRQRGGSAGLFAAVARVRPKMHCFGHMHRNWGAKKITWRDETASEEPSHFTDIDNDQSYVIETLSTLQAGKFDSEDEVNVKMAKFDRYEDQGYCDALDLRLENGMQTLFVNAAIEAEAEGDKHMPWIVELKLPGGKGGKQHDDQQEDEARGR